LKQILKAEQKYEESGCSMKNHFASIKKGSSSIAVQDWIIDQPYHLELNPAKNPTRRVTARFRRAKKLQNRDYSFDSLLGTYPNLTSGRENAEGRVFKHGPGFFSSKACFIRDEGCKLGFNPHL
jgi:hypothetical protein